MGAREGDAGDVVSNAPLHWVAILKAYEADRDR
jgi:hypothetical protein